MTSIPSLVPRDRYAPRALHLPQPGVPGVDPRTGDRCDGHLPEADGAVREPLSQRRAGGSILDGVRSAGAQVLGTSPDAVAVVAGASEGLGQATSLLEPEQGRSSSDRTSRA